MPTRPRKQRISREHSGCEPGLWLPLSVSLPTAPSPLILPCHTRIHALQCYLSSLACGVFGLSSSVSAMLRSAPSASTRPFSSSSAEILGHLDVGLGVIYTPFGHPRSGFSTLAPQRRVLRPLRLSLPH
ncbi:hypothetical protein BD311DRAFT_761482 [Dichomitus squalens]|uniref:Uncharacterized protein n=1 Tax=Dichomitus squalens TaxID=114155 RepID=A0A4Q9MJK9_9APHY|nr:hypothetical protein BD311DRAFT_761482 [Dichomitus squalens]